MDNSKYNCCISGCNEKSGIGSFYCDRHRAEERAIWEERERKHKEYIAAVIEDDGRFIAEDNIICPWCGSEWDADFEAEYYCNEGEHTEICEECGKSFIIETEVSISYNTRRRI